MSRALLFSCLFPLLTLAKGDNSQQGGGGNPQSPSDAGATGTQSGAFSLSTGAVVAIAVIASIVVVVGVGSAVLFWLAKKRQWDVRQSIRRASRRLTGRSTTDTNKDNRNNRRTGIRLNSPPPGKTAGSRQDKGFDVEKGLSVSETTTTISSVKK